MSSLDIDDAADDVRCSMYADDRQTQAELNLGLKSLNSICHEVESLRAQLDEERLKISRLSGIIRRAQSCHQWEKLDDARPLMVENNQ